MQARKRTERPEIYLSTYNASSQMKPRNNNPWYVLLKEESHLVSRHYWYHCQNTQTAFKILLVILSPTPPQNFCLYSGLTVIYLSSCITEDYESIWIYLPQKRCHAYYVARNTAKGVYICRYAYINSYDFSRFVLS